MSLLQVGDIKYHQSDPPCKDAPCQGVWSLLAEPLQHYKGEGSTSELKVRKMQISRDMS